MKVCRVSEMRALDQTAITRFGIPEALLMENAGHAVYDVLLQEVGIQDKSFGVFCGVGNNGGDGFVIARKIHSCGGRVSVFILGDAGKFAGAAKLNLEILSRLPVECLHLTSGAELQSRLQNCDVIIDAIFGTGLTREVTGWYGEVIRRMHQSGKTVISVDIPSGIHGDTGQIMGAAVRADFTVTFGLPKIGNLLFPGYEHCGKIFVSHISFPPTLYADARIKVELNRTASLPPRPKTAHKGDFGEVLFIAGASSYFGAPYFAALSFLKAGGGYARLAAPASMTPFLANKGSEIVLVPQGETPTGSLASRNASGLLELSERMDMVVLGPGLSLEEETQQLAWDLVRDIRKPLIIDGDGISAVCRDLEVVKQRQYDTVLTPHLGEMSRMTAVPVRDLEARKVDILQQTARELHATIVLKGAHSLIGYPDERVYINLSGNPGMATPGSGDVLTGTIAAMLGLGLDLDAAVRKGVFLHGVAGDLAAVEIGEDGMTAQDILDYLPRAVKMDRTGLPSPFRERYAGVHPV